MTWRQRWSYGSIAATTGKSKWGRSGGHEVSNVSGVEVEATRYRRKLLVVDGAVSDGAAVRAGENTTAAGRTRQLDKLSYSCLESSITIQGIP
jgi:hypothetical protein